MSEDQDGQADAQGMQIRGGAAIVAPVSAFKNGIPPNALIVLPVQKPTPEFEEKIKEGPLGVTPEQMWQLLGFNGPAVQVQDDQGRPLMIGLEDLLAGLEKHYADKPDELDRGRILAQKLVEHGRMPRAEQVLKKIVAKGGTGDDWLALGVAQLQQQKHETAESTLKGAANLLKANPYPHLHLAKLYKEREDKPAERAAIDKALEIDGQLVDAWAYLFQTLKDSEGEAKAIEEVSNLGKEKKSSRAFVAIQAFYSTKEETRDKAFEFGKLALETNPDDTLALLALSALHGQKGDLASVVSLLQPHEAKMIRDVRLANNYFEALFQSKQIDKVTKLLNALINSQNAQVKQFAMERTKLVQQIVQQQAQALANMQKRGLPS